MQETFKKVVGRDVRNDAAKITVPTLLVYGSRDMDTPVEFGRTYAGLIKNSELEIIPDAGHLLHIENNEVVVGIIRKFL
jgi:pimeloyl-ACP methyl ester carboxylesterase